MQTETKFLEETWFLKSIRFEVQVFFKEKTLAST